MLEQQEIIRSLMHELRLTRNDFCARYNVTRRALDSWLLPLDSKGFRQAPEATVKLIENELIAYFDGSMDSNSRREISNVDHLVGFDRAGVRIAFPPIYYLRAAGCLTAEQAILYNMPSGTYVDEKISFDSQPHINELYDEKILESGILSKAHSLNGSNYWMHVIHFTSAAGLSASYFTLLNSLHDEESIISCQSSCLNGQYFMFFMIPAPKWHQKPLIIYSANILEKSHPYNKIMLNVWQHVIDENGNSINLPDNNHD